MVSLSKILLLIAIFTFSSPLLDVQAKGGGAMGKGGGRTVDKGSSRGSTGKHYGNNNQQGKRNGQRLRDASCSNSNGQRKGSGKQIIGNDNSLRLKDGTGMRDAEERRSLVGHACEIRLIVSVGDYHEALSWDAGVAPAELLGHCLTDDDVAGRFADTGRFQSRVQGAGEIIDGRDVCRAHLAQGCS